MYASSVENVRHAASSIGARRNFPNVEVIPADRYTSGGEGKERSDDIDSTSSITALLKQRKLISDPLFIAIGLLSTTFRYFLPFGDLGFSNRGASFLQNLASSIRARFTQLRANALGGFHTGTNYPRPRRKGRRRGGGDAEG